MRIFVSIFAAFLSGVALGAAELRVVVRPQDTGEALVNPGMGWTFHFYSNMIKNYGSRLEASDTLADWPGLSVIYLRVPWAFLEPKEGEFNWALFDTPAQRWIAKGKQIALRVSCSESWMRYATPKWVQDAGAKGVEFQMGKGPTPGGPLWDPDYLDPVFLAKLDQFLGALARRYDGNPNVAFIDIGSFGMWGEGHTGMSSRLSEEATLEVAKRHIDLHLKHFTKTLLCLNDDVAGSSKPGAHFPATDYALSKGITLRDDSILVQPPPHSWYHAEMAQTFWPRLPVILEHEHYGSSKARGAWGDGSLLLKSVEDYHASYMSIHWWPREELNENRALIDAINRRMGYRLQLREISWPATVALGEPFTVQTRWANAGVAPCYAGSFWAYTLKDEKGGIVSVHVDEEFDVKKLKVGAPDQAPVEARQSRFTIALRNQDPLGVFAPPTKPGTYDVYVSVGERGGTPIIALPLSGGDGQRRYKVGRIQVVPARGSARAEGAEKGTNRQAAATAIVSSVVTVPYPRITMLWASVRNDRSLAGMARHDLIMTSAGRFGLKPNRTPQGLADGFTADSVPIARERLAELRRWNPKAIILCDQSFYEYGDGWLPEDHPWWLRKNGQRQQFWPGTHRMDWSNPEYQQKVVRQTAACQAVGFDGVFYDNLRQEEEAWLQVLQAVRAAVGDRFLILANCGYDVGHYDWLAPWLNGIMYESGWSHRRRTWDDCLPTMQHTQALLRAPRISVIERFEEIRDRAGWPNDPLKGQERPRDPAARRWSLCYALLLGDCYYLFSDSTSHQHDWYPEYDAKIGQPKGDAERFNDHVWQRRYDRALVVANLPGAQAPYEVVLTQPAQDTLSGESGTRFVIPPGDGRILLTGQSPSH